MNLFKRKPPISTWTLFWDMNSGGDRKEQWDKILIEAPEHEAISVFYSRFGHNPFRVTCTCCGEDYSVSEETDTLEQITGFHRDCYYNEETQQYEERDNGKDYGTYVTLDAYLARPNVLVIRADQIKPEERTARVPTQGYVWTDDA